MQPPICNSRSSSRRWHLLDPSSQARPDKSAPERSRLNLPACFQHRPPTTRTSRRLERQFRWRGQNSWDDYSGNAANPRSLDVSANGGCLPAPLHRRNTVAVPRRGSRPSRVAAPVTTAGGIHSEHTDYTARCCRFVLAAGTRSDRADARTRGCAPDIHHELGSGAGPVRTESARDERILADRSAPGASRAVRTADQLRAGSCSARVFDCRHSDRRVLRLCAEHLPRAPAWRVSGMAHRIVSTAAPGSGARHSPGYREHLASVHRGSAYDDDSARDPDIVLPLDSARSLRVDVWRVYWNGRDSSVFRIAFEHHAAGGICTGWSQWWNSCIARAWRGSCGAPDRGKSRLTTGDVEASRTPAGTDDHVRTCRGWAAWTARPGGCASNACDGDDRCATDPHQPHIRGKGLPETGAQAAAIAARSGPRRRSVARRRRTRGPGGIQRPIRRSRIVENADPDAPIQRVVVPSLVL